MKFQSKKDTFYKLLVLSIALILNAFFVTDFIQSEDFSPWQLLPVLIINYIIFYTYLKTRYEIKDGNLICMNLYTKVSIPIDRIHSLTFQNKYLFGSHPATTKSGLLISYKTFQNTYITP